MSDITAFIVDDERLVRRELKEILVQDSRVEVIGEASKPQEAIDLIEENEPELLFLDIKMPQMDGFELLQKLDKVPFVIFVTAYDEYAIKAFEVNALDYLLKPVDKERLEKTIQKVIEKIEQEEKENIKTQKGVLSENDRIFLKDNDKCWFVNLKDIRLFESEGNYVKVYFENKKPLILKSLQSLENRLDSKSFFRVSRKHILNLNWIEKIDSWFNGRLKATLKDGMEVEISRRQAAKFKEIMSL
ncbi:MAG: LytR/AlgR family response regulator transcription factor [Flavobacteriales bacterium]